MTVRILIGDAREKLKELADESVHCVVTSPPYWGLRDYGVAGQIGLETDFQDYIESMVSVFRDVRRVLRRDGTLWLNLGDCYANDGKWGGRTGGKQAYLDAGSRERVGREKRRTGLKPKDLVGIPWRVALALQTDGWWLRSALPWVKRNVLPERVGDRPSTAVEYVFMLTKAARYWWDGEAVRRASSPSTHARVAQDVGNQQGSARANGGAKPNGPMKAVIRRPKRAAAGQGNRANDSFENATCHAVLPDRNWRNADLFFDSLDPAFGLISLRDGTPIALDVNPLAFKDAHFATFPPRLVEPLIRASCPRDGTVLDPFGGSGTTALVADGLGRHAILIEINPAYAEIASRRLANDAGMFADVAAS